jgi:hypothetical protein
MRRGRKWLGLPRALAGGLLPVLGDLAAALALAALDVGLGGEVAFLRGAAFVQGLAAAAALLLLLLVVLFAGHGALLKIRVAGSTGLAAAGSRVARRTSAPAIKLLMFLVIEPTGAQA